MTLKYNPTTKQLIALADTGADKKRLKALITEIYDDKRVVGGLSVGGKQLSLVISVEKRD